MSAPAPATPHRDLLRRNRRNIAVDLKHPDGVGVVLDLVGADSADVGRLAALYRRARFSDHELTETDRAAALASLDAIHAALGTPAGRRP